MTPEARAKHKREDEESKKYTAWAEAEPRSSKPRRFTYAWSL